MVAAVEEGLPCRRQGVVQETFPVATARVASQLRVIRKLVHLSLPIYLYICKKGNAVWYIGSNIVKTLQRLVLVEPYFEVVSHSL